MPESTHKWSLGSRVNIIIASVVTLAMLLFTALSTLLVADSERRALVNNAEALAQQLSVQASDSLLSEARGRFLFSGLAAHRFLEHVHLYSVRRDSDYPELVTTYSAGGRAPIATQSERIENLPSYQFAFDSLEVAQPIFTDSELSGYIYLRASLEQVRSAHRRHIFISFIALIVVLTGTILSVRIFLRTLESTLLRFSRTIATASQDLNFDIEQERDIPEELLDVRLQVKRLLEKYRHEKRYAQHSAQQAQRAHEELEAEVAERTQNLSEVNNKLTKALEKLHQHQRQHLEYDKLTSLGKFTGGFSQILTTPLDTSISAANSAHAQLQQITQALSKKSITESQLSEYCELSRHNLSSVLTNLSRCSDLINHFQDMERLNRNDQPQSIPLKVLFQRLEHSIGNELQLPEHVKIKISYAPPNEIITSRKLVIEQVVLELVDNAIAHASIREDSDTIQPLLIDIAANYENDFLVLTVKDNGIGIAPDIKQAVFKPFINQQHKGNECLGLYQVFNWVTQLLNGEIECTSISYVENVENQQHGTIFVIKIPTLNK